MLSLISILNIAHAEGDPVVLSTQMFQSHGRIFLAPLDGWVFKPGNDPGWADPQLKVDDWQRLNPTEINAGMEDASGRISGIPEHIKKKIFQPFFTTKPTGQGTGLGLSLSYDIVKAHGGELTVETEEGEGSEFVISLPIV